MICCHNCGSTKLDIKQEDVFNCLYFICLDCGFPDILPHDHIAYRHFKLEKIKEKYHGR